MSIEVDRDREWKPMMKKIMDKLKDIEDKAGLAESNTKATLETIDKFLKKVK